MPSRRAERNTGALRENAMPAFAGGASNASALPSVTACPKMLERSPGFPHLYRMEKSVKTVWILGARTLAAHPRTSGRPSELALCMYSCPSGFSFQLFVGMSPSEANAFHRKSGRTPSGTLNISLCNRALLTPPRKRSDGDRLGAADAVVNTDFIHARGLLPGQKARTCRAAGQQSASK